ncbi:Lrp/AsnC family transcriptional regulator [Variovorax saccharolyticus]|uniref:Lrp/AsnC family transcriptional regulator n=1 Tax=Variovorax saccharolyticus TaxID=3053516 RepID=UPI002576A5E1|nr:MULTISPECIES: Lrp/AsnC family transcriptional regulator [unclassified Variovorax]MDM0018762.1 Lrp/AsnC family transcriptional regulator [Variovorax sp. J22R187]MDM0029267.1 Lrp/AsnC family transcriptional regulator [Variovorax sp. J31P216]
MNPESTLDSLDQRIISALQANGRLSYEELGTQVGLSASAALRRVKRLEESGVIAGYVALVRARKIGLGLTAYINVRMEKHTGGDKRSPMDLFAATVQTWPEVIDCVSLTGEMDYLLRIVVADMDHYTRFVMDTLLKHPSVQDCKTSFVMRPVKATATLV